MPTKVALYTLEDDCCKPEFEVSMGCCEGDTCSDLRIRMEVVGVIEWLFLFWDDNEKYRIKAKMERLNPVGDKVFIVRSTIAKAETGKRTFDKAFGPS
jgi:hypothetical protein